MSQWQTDDSMPQDVAGTRLRLRKPIGVATTGDDDANDNSIEVETRLDAESGTDLLDTDGSRRAKLKWLLKYAYASLLHVIWFVGNRAWRTYRYVDQLASIFIGNEMQWIGSMSSNRLEQLNEWFKRHQRRLQVYTLSLVAGCSGLYLIFVMLVVALSAPQPNTHIFVPHDVVPLSFATVYDVPIDFTCSCRTLTPIELETDSIFRDDMSMLDTDAGSSKLKATLHGVLAMNEALLDPARGHGRSIASPKLWNSTNAEDLEFINAEHRFNPCVVSVVTHEFGVLHMVNPVVVNEQVAENDASLLEKRSARETVNVFGFLMNGIVSERFVKVQVRFRTVPHVTAVQVKEFTGVDAIVVQAAIQLISDGYKGALEKARGLTEKWKRANRDFDLVRERVRFDVNAHGLLYEMGSGLLVGTGDEQHAK